MDRAELIIKLTGDREALTSLKNLEAAMKNLNNSKTQLRIDKSLLDREIADVRNQIKALTKEKYEVRLEGGDTAELDAQIRNLRDNLDALTAERRGIQLDISDINLANAGLKEVEHDLESANQAAADFLNTLASVFDGLSSLSGASASFASGIGDAFTAMAGLFDTNLFDYMQRKLTYMFTEGIVGDFSKIVSRYDILSTFTQYMDAAGISSEKSAEALQRVNDAILGLPIGLDEAAYRLRRYQMFIGDINDATNLTIGLQNALLAGGASESMRNIAYQQIDRLLSAGKLNTSRQWLALIQGLGVSLKYVTQEMGVTGMTTREFAAGLTNGTISTDQFLRALMNLGEGTSQAARDLNGLLEIYKTTLESWISNIQFAAVRGGETVLKSLNEALLDTTDQGIVGYLRDLRDAMNDFYKGVGGFITGNPELLSRNINAFQGLFDAIGRFSASNIATMIFDNLARGVDMLTGALNKLPTDEVEQFIAFAVTLAGPLGALFDIVASGAPFVIAVFERFKDFDFEHLLDRIITEVDRLAGVFETLLNLLSDEALTEIITYGLVYGAPAAKGFSAVAQALQGLASALIVINGLKGISILTGGSTFMSGLGAALNTVAEAVTTLGQALAFITGEFIALSGGLAALASSAGLIVGVVAPLMYGDYRRLQNRREELGVDNMSREELQSRIDDLRGSDRLQEIIVGTDAARQANDDLRIYEDALRRVDDIAAQTAESIEDYAEAVDVAADAEEKAANTSQTLESRLTEIENRISVAAEQVGSVLAKQIDIFSEYEQAAVRAFTGENSLTSALDSNITALEDYEKNLEKAARIIAENPDIGFDVSSLFQKVAMGGLDNAGDLASLVDAFENNYDAFLEYVEKYVTEQDLHISVESWAAVLGAGLSSDDMALYLTEQFGTAIERALATMPDTLANRLGAESHFEELEAFGVLGATSDGLRSKFAPVGEAMAEGITDGMKSADMTEAGQQAAQNSIQATADALAEADYNPIAETLATNLATALGEAFAELDLLSLMFNTEDMTGITETFGMLTEVLSVLTDETLVPFTEQVTVTHDSLILLHEGALLPIEEITLAFYDTHLPELQTAIIDLIDTIKSLIDELDRLIDALEEAQRKADKLRAAIEDLGRAIARQLPILDEFIGTINGISSAAAEAAEAVNALAAAMSALESVDVGLSFEAPTASTTSNGVIRPAYRASGGFIPRGTDTVPAMLTPGEFVMRRSAVKAFGVDFMRRLNNLDIGGMVAAMYRQIPQMAGFMPIYNNTYNNDNRNVSVNQNIYTNNPSYTYRMASRWAHAL